MSTVAKFDGQQFGANEVAEKVIEQYDSEVTRTFYQVVMGDGGHDIHYGIYREPTDTIRVAAQATTDFMLDMANWVRPLKSDSKVMDLGSGHGGAMQTIVQRFGCSVQGINISEEQNAMNLEECKRLGISDKVEIGLGNIEEGLPEEWTESFDAVFSSEVLCHIGDKEAALKHVKRVLKPGGVLVFSDIMGADDATEEQLKAFTDRNATTKMGRPKTYIQTFKDVGLKYISWVDLSHNYLKFNQQMLANVDAKYDELKKVGASDEYLGNWKKSLSERCATQEKYNVFAWGVFCAVKL